MRVAIVGAGISGLYLGWKLAERGHQVSIFEKRKNIGKETCSGLFSQRIRDFLPQSEPLIQNEIDFTLIHFPKKTLKIKFSKRFFVINHLKLDRLVAKLAKNAGAKIVNNYQVNYISRAGLSDLRPATKGGTPLESSFFGKPSRPKGRGFPGKLKEQEFNKFQEGFERVIGCDGANSMVRKSIGLAEPKFYLALQGFISKRSLAPFVETWPTQSGFLWKIPRGNEIEYGILEKPEKARQLFQEFLNRNNLSLKKIKSAIVPQGLIVPSNDTEKITLCGDAAGLTKPWSGGGVIWSLISAEILLKNFPDFLKYKKGLKRTFLPKIILSKTIKRLVYFLGFNFPWLLPKNYKIESDFLV